MPPQVPPPRDTASAASFLRLQVALLQPNLPELRGDTRQPEFRSFLDSSMARTTSPAGLLTPLTLPLSAPMLPETPPLQPVLARALPGVLRPVLQADTAEYASLADARKWGGSSCSAASLAAVLRSRGSQARVGDVVQALEARGGITVAQGLVSRPALVETARRFGLDARDQSMTFDQLSRAAASGPVLVDIRNGRFPEGHWLAVTGADASGVSLVDSSGHRLTHMSRAEFESAWSGRGVAFGTPASTTAPLEAPRA